MNILGKAFFLAFLLSFVVSCGRPGAQNSNSIANVVQKAVGTAPLPQDVKISSPDGVVLVGTLFESEKANSPGLLLLHQWQSDRHSWDDFAKDLQNDGFNVLTIDGRGFGDSTKRSDGTAVAANRTDADVKAMLGDVDSAFSFLSKQSKVDASRLGIIGASYGSSLALIYAADHPNVAAIALLSPGTNYFGNMHTGPAISKYGARPSFMASAEDDPDSNKAVVELAALTTEPNRAVVVSVPKGGHGTALLKVDEVRKPLAAFFKERLGIQPQK